MIVLCPAALLLCSFVAPLLCAFAACLRLGLPPSHHTHTHTHLQPALTWRRLLNVNASFVLAYDFTFRRFPMQLHIRPRSAALHDERFVCVAHHAMLRRTQCQTVMVIGQDASCKDRKRKREREWGEWVSGNGQSLLVNGSLIAAAAAQLATRLKCKLKTCSQLAQDDSLPVFSGSLVLSPFCSPTCSLHLHNATNSSKSNNYHTHTHKVRHTHLHLQLSEVFVKPKGRIKSSSDAMQRTTNI